MYFKRLFGPALITLLAAWLRWHRLEDTRLLWDHAYPTAQAQHILSEGHWPALGQVSSFFLSNPPGQAYINLIPLYLFGSFWGVIWFMTTLNLLAVPLLYRLGRDLMSERVGLISALLFAVNPWVLTYSRTAWSSAAIPIATAALLALILPALSGKLRTRAASGRVFAALIILTVFSQTYLLALLIVPLQVGLVMLLRMRHVPWRAALSGALVWLCFTSLFIFSLLGDWTAQTVQLAKFQRVSAGPPEFKIQAFQLAVRYVTGQAYPLPGVTSIFREIYQAVGWVLAAFLSIGIVFSLIGMVQRASDAWVSVALLGWWLTPVALLSFNNSEIHPWHLRLSLPAGYMLTALGIDWLTVRHPWSKWVLPLAGAGLALVFVTTFSASNLANAVRPASGSLDEITLGASRQVGKVLREITAHYNLNEGYANVPPPDLTAWSQRPLETVSWFIDPHLIIVPLGRPALYIRLGHAAPPPPFALAQREATLSFPGGDFATFDVFPARDRATLASLPQTKIDWPSETGLTLLGYTLGDLRPPRTASTITTYWLIENLADSRHNYIYAPYVHLNTPEGSTILNVGAPGLPGYYYRLNDLYIQPIPLNIPLDTPPGSYELEIGLYDGLHTMGTTFFPRDDIPRPFFTTFINLP